jgi:hypothetical protein
MNRRRWLRAALLAGAVLLAAGTGPARAADEDVSFKRRGDEEKQFVAKVGRAVVKAAHPTGKNPELVQYEVKNPKPNRTELHIQMDYKGQVTNKTYKANIVVKVDSTNKDAWEVLNIDYSDNNNIRHNAQKVQDLIKRFNR